MAETNDPPFPVPHFPLPLGMFDQATVDAMRERGNNPPPVASNPTLDAWKFKWRTLPKGREYGQSNK